MIKRQMSVSKRRCVRAGIIFFYREEPRTKSLSFIERKARRYIQYFRYLGRVPLQFFTPNF